MTTALRFGNGVLAAAALSLLLCAVPPAAAQLYPDSDITSAQSFAAPRLIELGQVLQRQDAAALNNLLLNWTIQAAATPLTYESLLHAAIAPLQAQVPWPPARAELEQLALYRPQIIHLLQHDGREVARRRYPVDTAAQAALRQWDIETATLQLEDVLHDGIHPQAGTWPTQALAAALARVPDAALATLPPGLDATWPTAALLVLAERRNLAQDWLALMWRPATPALLRALPQLWQHQPEDEAYDLLSAAIANPQLASAAVLALGAGPVRQRTETLWLQGLVDPQLGSSHAAAMAPHLNAALRTQLAHNLSANDGPLLRHTILALQLDNSDDARALLRAFAANPARPAAARAKALTP